MNKLVLLNEVVETFIKEHTAFVIFTCIVAAGIVVVGVALIVATIISKTKKNEKNDKKGHVEDIK